MDLDRARDLAYIRKLENQLQYPNENHPRWTASGDLVLIGDRGTFGGEEGVVEALYPRDDIVLVNVDGTVLPFTVTDCRELIERGKLPPLPSI